MKNILYLLLLMPVLGCFCQIEGRVKKVLDGDTFEMVWQGKTRRCRLAHVDAPELKQHYGRMAADSLFKILTGKLVTVDTIGKDRYGRLLVNVKLNGLSLDSLVLRKGWAWYYYSYANNPLLEREMKAAINAGAGLWLCGVAKVCPPWLYRQYNERYKRTYCVGCR